MATTNLAEEMKKLADGAVEVAKKAYQLKLDYSVDSLKTADKIFSYLHKEATRKTLIKFVKRGLTEEQISSAAMVMGAYVGEVIRRAHGGEWVQEDIDGKKDVIFLRIDGHNIFPIGKAYMRIKNGIEDNIYFYYQVVTREILKKDE